MAISFTRTFANLTSALLSYLDDNFNDINTWITSFFGTATGVQTTAAPNKIPMTASTFLVAWVRLIFTHTTGNSNFGASGGFYTSISGDSGTNVTVDAGTVIPIDGTLSNLTVNCKSNTLSGTCVVTLVKNGVDTAMTVTITAGSAATFVDSSHTVSVTAGDRFLIKYVPSGTGAIFNPTSSLVFI